MGGPQMGMPPAQGGWAPQGGMAPQRPMGVTLAAIYLIVVGILIVLAGAACGIFGAAASTGESQLPGIGALGGSIVVVGIILIVIGVLSILAGWGAWGGKGWARWLGIVISVIFGGLGLLGAVTSGNISNNLTTLVISVLYLLCAAALFMAGPFFAARR